MANFPAWWRLEISPDYQNGAHLELTMDDLGHIAELIEQGYREGEIVEDEREESDGEQFEAVAPAEVLREEGCYDGI